MRTAVRRGRAPSSPCATPRASVVVTAAGTPRGMEVLAHLAARTGVAMAANVVSFDGLSPFAVTRQVVGGSVLEEMVLDERPAVFTVAGHAVEAAPAETPGAATLVEARPEVAGGRPRGPGRVRRTARARPLGEPQVGARRRRRGPRRGQLRRVLRPAGADRAARRLARRLARGHQPRLASPPRAGRPDRQPDLARALHPLRHLRRDPALGRLLDARRRSWPSTPTPTRRWSPRRTTP